MPLRWQLRTLAAAGTAHAPTSWGALASYLGPVLLSLSFGLQLLAYMAEPTPVDE